MTAGARASASGDAHDANATASTLNYALGRRHMKSWMTGAYNNNAPAAPHDPSTQSIPPSVRKRERPRKYPLPDLATQLATEAARATSSTARLPLSNSTSPQLANVVTNHQRAPSHGSVHGTVLPSPTPSEEIARNVDAQSHNSAPQQRANMDDAHRRLLQSPDLSSPPPATASQSLMSHRLAAPKRPMEESAASSEKRMRTDEPRSQQSATVSTQTVGSPPALPLYLESTRRTSAPHAPHTPHVIPSLAQAPSDNCSFSQAPNGLMASSLQPLPTQDPGRLPGSHSGPAPVQGQYVLHPPAPQAHVAPPLSAQPSETPSNAPVQHAVQPHRVLPPPRRPSSDQDEWYSFETCLQILSTFKASAVGPCSRRDGDRLAVLEEAVADRDWAYLTLHQYYCLMTHSPQALPQSLNLQYNGDVRPAYVLLREVLDGNSQLSPRFLAFFCTFPFPVDYLASTWPARFQYAQLDLVRFVNYAANSAQLRQLCERRRIPPTPRELAKYSITSFTFQSLFLRTVVRWLWRDYPAFVPEKRHLENELVRVFKRAWLDFDQQRSLGQLGGRAQAQEELQAWSFTFTHLTSLLEAALRRQGVRPVTSASPRFHLQQHQQQRPPPPPPPPPHNTANAPQSRIQASADDMTRSHRRRQPPAQATPHRTASHTQVSSRSRQGFTALLPRLGLVQPQQRVPNPSRFGLHQAHLRSPTLKATVQSSPLYYFWQGFMAKPKRTMNPNNAIERISFMMSEKEMEFLANSSHTAQGAAGERLIDENRKILRLRCVKWPTSEEPKESTWAIAENSWIPHSYFTFNGNPLQLRRKLHHGKDLPIDLTGFVRGGENVLEISVMSNGNDTGHRGYLVAIEFLGTMTQTTVRERCHKNSLSARDIINDIKRKLSVDETDDDVAIVGNTLTINLRDPFSASKLCDTPVRSKACLHNECFDLDTFLETRPRKGDVSAADQWRCPICKADARPNMLVVDNFLVEVRKELEGKGLLETRAIVVEQDGSWRPKPEERDPNGVRDEDTPEPEARPSAKAVVHEIIELDSD